MKDNENNNRNNNEKISNQFSIEDTTLIKIKQFMKNYEKNNLNESINDLINLGLANLGYSNKEKIFEKLKLNNKEQNIDIFSIPKNSKKTIYQIIKSLTQQSRERNAHRTNILLEARSKGISPTKTTEILDTLKLKGEIYEPKKDYFKLS